VAKEAAEKYQGSDDPSYYDLMAYVALGLAREAEFRQATEALVHKYPELMTTHLYHGMLLAMDGSWIAAECAARQLLR
jgi:hypothetical protein